MFTFYICRLIWALYTLKMPNLLNLKKLLQNGEARGGERKFVADALIPFLIPFPQKNYCRRTEWGIGVYEKRFLAA